MPDEQIAPTAPANAATDLGLLSRAFLTTGGTAAIAAVGNLPLPTLAAICAVSIIYLITHSWITVVKIKAGIPVKN